MDQQQRQARMERIDNAQRFITKFHRKQVKTLILALLISLACIVAFGVFTPPWLAVVLGLIVGYLIHLISTMLQPPSLRPVNGLLRMLHIRSAIHRQH